MIELERPTYTALSWSEFINNFVENPVEWFNVLDQPVVDWFVDRIDFDGDILESMLLVARDDPYPDKYLNVGIIDCTFATGHLIEGGYLALFDNRQPLWELFPKTERQLSEKARWSMREYLSAYRSGGTEKGIAQHIRGYLRTEEDIKARLNWVKSNGEHIGWATTRIDAATEVPNSLLFAPFTQRREVSLLVEELNLINSRVTISFDSIIRNLPLEGIVDVIPTMIKLGATNGHIDCMALPWITHSLVAGTCCAGGGKYINKRYLARELLILQEIKKSTIDIDERKSIYEAVVLANCPNDFTRKAANAIRHIDTPLDKLIWCMGPKYQKPIFIGENPAYAELSQVDKVRATIKSGDPDATTYEPIESPARPAPIKLKGFADVSEPVPRKSSDPTPLGSLRAGASPVEPSRLDKVEADVAKLTETNAAILQMLTKLESKL